MVKKEGTYPLRSLFHHCRGNKKRQRLLGDLSAILSFFDTDSTPFFIGPQANQQLRTEPDL